MPDVLPQSSKGTQCSGRVTHGATRLLKQKTTLRMSVTPSAFPAARRQGRPSKHRPCIHTETAAIHATASETSSIAEVHTLPRHEALLGATVIKTTTHVHITFGAPQEAAQARALRSLKTSGSLGGAFVASFPVPLFAGREKQPRWTGTGTWRTTKGRCFMLKLVGRRAILDVLVWPVRRAMHLLLAVGRSRRSRRSTPLILEEEIQLRSPMVTWDPAWLVFLLVLLFQPHVLPPEVRVSGTVHP